MVRAPACHAGGRGFETRLSRYLSLWGIAKLVKAVDFGSTMQRFESFCPNGSSHIIFSMSTLLLIDRDTTLTLLLVVVASLLLSGVILALSFLLAVQSPDPEKTSAYECGFEPFEDARNRFDVRFYIVAILFLLFDVEVAFLFP